MTSVDECTRDDTGVGAAMAAGSQAEKGDWALFVIAEATIRMLVILHIFVFVDHNLSFHMVAIAIISVTSPTRLE